MSQTPPVPPPGFDGLSGIEGASTWEEFEKELNQS